MILSNIQSSLNVTSEYRRDAFTLLLSGALLFRSWLHLCGTIFKPELNWIFQLQCKIFQKAFIDILNQRNHPWASGTYHWYKYHRTTWRRRSVSHVGMLAWWSLSSVQTHLANSLSTMRPVRVVAWGNLLGLIDRLCCKVPVLVLSHIPISSRHVHSY